MNIFATPEPVPCRSCGAQPDLVQQSDTRLFLHWCECPNKCIPLTPPKAKLRVSEAIIQWNEANA